MTEIQRSKQVLESLWQNLMKELFRPVRHNIMEDQFWSLNIEICLEFGIWNFALQTFREWLPKIQPQYEFKKKCYHRI